MPPSSFGFALEPPAWQSHVQLETRNLDWNDANTPVLSASQVKTLEILAITFSTFSIASTTVTFLWFLKMRRNFRHDLIMLLIQSDMLKALWFMIYPIVVFARGPVPVDSTFCQVSGFFLAWGIEASDVAVFMIAAHTALHIFRPRSSGGEGGLFPYRRIAYSLWVILPILSASLAFINRKDAYVSAGTYCYLPVRPFWYRLALSWIPRYLIFIFILGIYASIYYYVRYKFHNFSTPEGTTSKTKRAAGRRPGPVVPSTPELMSHGLIPDSRKTSAAENDATARKQSVSTVASIRPMASRLGAHRFIWGSFSLPDSAGYPPSPPSELNTDVDSFVGPSTPQPLPPTSLHTITPRPQDSDESNTAITSRATSWRDAFVHRFSPSFVGDASNKPSNVDIVDILRQHPNSSNNLTPISQLQLVNSQGQNYAAAEMIITRGKIRRQLRFLFIYPLVYMGLWILPFVSHVLSYNDKFAVHPLFGLRVLTIICLCSQAAVDCWLFSTRERPWLHIPGSDGSFWTSLQIWSGWGALGKCESDRGPGRSREETFRDARVAYQRRDVELAERSNFGAVEPSPRGERSWWEPVGFDWGISPVREEVPDPMEDEESIDPLSQGASLDQKEKSTEPGGKAEEPEDSSPEKSA